MSGASQIPREPYVERKVARRTRSFNDASTSTYRANAKLRNRTGPGDRGKKTPAQNTDAESSSAPDSNAPIEYPIAFEANPADSMFLQSYKALLRKHLSLRKPQTLYEEVLLAVFLTAVGRTGQGLQIVTFLGHHFDYIGDLEQWKPVAMGICLQSRLLRLAKRSELAGKAMQKLATQPFLSKTADAMRETISGAPAIFDAAMMDKSTKVACLDIARLVLELRVFAEVARYDRSLKEAFDMRELELLIEDGMHKLNARISD